MTKKEKLDELYQDVEELKENLKWAKEELLKNENNEPAYSKLKMQLLAHQSELNKKQLEYDKLRKFK